MSLVNTEFLFAKLFSIELLVPTLACIIITTLVMIRFIRQLRRQLNLAQTEIAQTSNKLKLATRELNSLFDHVDMVAFVIEANGLNSVYANLSTLRLFNTKNLNDLNDAITRAKSKDGKTFSNVLSEHARQCESRGTSHFTWHFEQAPEHLQTQTLTLTNSTYSGKSSTLITGKNITKHRREQTLANYRKSILTCMSMRNPLEDTLKHILSFQKENSGYQHCGIMQADITGSALNWVCWSGISEHFLAATNEMPVLYGEGSCGTAAALLRRSVCKNIDSDALWDNYREAFKLEGIKASWSEPVVSSDSTLLGTFVVFQKTPWTPCDDDIDLLTEPMYYTSLAMENANKAQQLESSLSSERLVNKLSTKLLNFDYEDSGTTIEDAIGELASHFSLSKIAIHKKCTIEDTFFTANRWPPLTDADPTEGATFNANLPTITTYLEQEGICLVGHCNSENKQFSGKNLFNTTTGMTAIYFSITNNECPSYILEVQANQVADSFRQHGLVTFQIFASMLNSVFNQKSLLDTLAYRALRDKLTGMYNRHKIEDNLNQELQRTERYGGTFSIMLIDIDKFKSVNDTFGHNAGDDVLKVTAELILKTARSSDICGRWGGEEFVIILSEQTLEGATIFANNLLAVVESHNFPIPRPVTISAGLSQRRPGDTIESVIHRADKGLYEAKESGRNCFKIVGSEAITE